MDVLNDARCSDENKVVIGITGLGHENDFESLFGKLNGGHPGVQVSIASADAALGVERLAALSLSDCPEVPMPTKTSKIGATY